VPAIENNVISNAMDHINQWIFCDPNLYITSLVNKPTPIFPPVCMYQTYFGNCCSKMINIFTKWNTHISKIPFQIQEITTTNTYLPTQIWVLHVWPKKPIPIFSFKCNYCKSIPKIHYIFYDLYVSYCNFGHIS
jgi:hypothetical protein